MTASAVDVLVDGSGRLGALAYFVPAGVSLSPGDAVSVPFGKQTRSGLVLGPAREPGKATKSVLERLGQRVDPLDLQLAAELAEFHLASFESIASRLSPKAGKSLEPLDAGPVALVPSASVDPVLPAPPKPGLNRFYLRAPLVSPARLAALEAERLAAAGGQVLVLCPTVALLEDVLAEFASGAGRLDSKAKSGSWRGFREGTLRVGIGTRSAALYSAASLGGVVVVEEEHPGHLEAQLPYTNARDLGVRRARMHGCPVTLISACPSAAGMGSRVKVLPVGSRSDFPGVLMVDRTLVPPHSRLVPPKLRQALDQAARDGLPAVVIAEKQAARRICARCADPRPCQVCSVSGCTHPEASACGRCADTGIRWVGWDVTRLGQLLPEASPMLLADLTPWSAAGAQAQASVPSGRPVSGRVVVLFDIDGLLSSTGSLEPQHQAAGVLSRASEAAGPGGRVVVVTSLPDNPVLQAWLRRDPLAIAKVVYAHAKTQGLPPFGRVVTVRVNWEKPPRTDGWPGVVLGPRKRAGEWELLVLVDDAQLPALRDRLEKLRRRGRSRVWVR